MISNGNSSASVLSPTWRYATNALSLWSVFCFSGIIFGWAPLELLLLQEGQYGELCTTADEEGDGGSTSDTNCPAQINRLNAMFTLAQFWLSFASLPVGFLLDMAPKPVHFAIAGILEATGLVLMAFSNSNGSDYFIFAYSLLALGGSMTTLGAFPASFLLPKHQAGILASIACLFDASSIIFTVFFKLFEYAGVSRQDLFLTYAVVAVVVYSGLVACWAYLERKDWKNVIDKEDEEEDGILKDQQDGVDTDGKNGASSENNSASLQNSHARRIQALGLQDWSVPQQLRTWEFGLAVLFASSQMLRCNFYIMTVDNFLLSIGDNDALYANLFSWILPGGIVYVPLIEATVSRLGVLKTLHVTNMVGLLFGVLLFLPILAPVQVINFGIFTCFRAYLYSTLNTFIAVTFGVKTMGRLIGFVFTTAAVVSLVQYPLSVWTTTIENGNFLPANIMLAILSLLPIGTALWYDRICRIAAAAQGNEGDALMKKVSYGSHLENKPSSLSERNTAFVVSSPGAPSLSAIRRGR